MKDKEIEELIQLLKELDDELIQCMKCGMCQAVCPLYKTTLLEPDVARGKITLIYHLLNKLIEDPKGIKEVLNRCLLCGSCASNCPSGVNTLKIFLKTKVVIAKYLGLSPIKRILFRKIISKPNLFNFFAKATSKLQSLLTEKVDPALNSRHTKLPIPFLKDRHLISLATNFFHESTGKIDDPKENTIKVGLFVGCLIDKIFPDIASDTLYVLKYFGISVFLPENQICCGIPAISSGDTIGFVSLVKKVINEYPVDKFDYLITPCATCASTIKKVWPMFSEEFDKKTKEKLLFLSSVTKDINEFLVNVLKVNSDTFDKKEAKPLKRVTYHDPCHLKKSLGIFKEPRALLMLNKSFKFIEMNEPDSCCGMGGSFNLTYYDISKKIGEKKLRNILNTKADVVATSCPACMIQITDVLTSSGVSKVSVKHPVQILRQALEGEQ